MNRNTLFRTVDGLNRRTYKNFGKSKDLSVAALALAEKYKTPSLIAQSHTALGTYYAAIGESERTIHHLTIAEKIFLKLKENQRDKWWFSLLYCHFGIAYDDCGEYAKALRSHKKSLSLDMESNHTYGQQRALMNIGHTYLRLGDGEAAIKYLGETVRHPEQAPIITSAAFGKMGEVYKHKSHYELAISSYLQAAKFDVGGERIKKFLANAASCLIQIGNLKEAEALIASAELSDVGEKIILSVENAVSFAKCELQIANQAYDAAWDICLRSISLSTKAKFFHGVWDAKYNQGIILFKQKRYEASVALLIELLKEPIPFVLSYRIQERLIEINVETENWKQAAYTLQALNQQKIINQSRLLSLNQLQEELQRLEKIKEMNDLLSQRNLELEALHSDKDNLFRIVAHDLKEPIVAALVMLDKLDKVKTQMSNEDRQVQIARAIDVMKQMSNIVSQLTVSAQIERNQTQETFEIVRLDRVVERVVTEKMTSAKAKGQHLLIGSLTTAAVRGHKIWLVQIMSNLISNSIKYSHAGGTIRVSLFVRGEEGKAFIEVQDDGQGLSVADRQHLFIKYRKLSAVPTGNEAATGLGLYIVKQLAKKMGGKVSAESLGKNKGSAFSVELPLVQGNNVAAPR